ncbi:hypothetical protein LCGC14_1162750 [marine sediment metagenome]|uniref:Uncharacterized protein n=1 Tax=marine sediment metagenome TaxID=412755 RepID=A0A0F9MF64_9ZZZZ|nr:hypothetical protein [bacterium]
MNEDKINSDVIPAINNILKKMCILLKLLDPVVEKIRFLKNLQLNDEDGIFEKISTIFGDIVVESSKITGSYIPHELASNLKN